MNRGLAVLLSVFLLSCSANNNKSGLLSQINTVVPPPEDMVLIPAGDFLMGSDKVDADGAFSQFGLVKQLYEDEHPLHKVNLPSYYIDIYEVTNEEYASFVSETFSPIPPHWEDGSMKQEDGTKPVTNVSWYQANRYCGWAGKRLPTEAEWEKAGRGGNDDKRDFPWGEEFDKTKANTGLTGGDGLAQVGAFRDGVSPFGVYDMSGNAWEWTADWYMPYEGSQYKSDKFGQKYKVLKGGSWGGVGHYSLSYFYRIPYRFYAELDFGYPDVGFRCVKDL